MKSEPNISGSMMEEWGGLKGEKRDGVEGKVDWKHMGIGLPSHASALDPCCQSGQAAKHNQLPLKLRVY
ncbi:2-phytyl-14-naphtoquinone methyltransferase [Dissostichus eleginoides]|uniref:2-phytyl-14-naphtoquinone methyltransferase n=1 Tax=Dissostichus eleginoides TaxID=100907 RepID=A0AAD9BDS5_DISEL|nr:2-phytyl-14-naphtoquinone methyltransferase [Dissostichus eleginoides]